MGQDEPRELGVDCIKACHLHPSTVTAEFFQELDLDLKVSSDFKSNPFSVQMRKLRPQR